MKFEIQVRTILQHAWAEIEHDRNYKFNGVLPSEIRRRFKILAGSLELMDREFNSISSEIDNIAKNVTIADKKDDLKDVEINSTTLKSYLHTHFKRIIDLNIINPTFNKKDVQIIGELSKFGIKTLNDLRETIPIDFEETIIENHKQFGLQTNYLGILRNMMIIKDPDKYFTKAWAKDWNGIGARTQNLLENYIDFEKIKTKYFSKS